MARPFSSCRSAQPFSSTVRASQPVPKCPAPSRRRSRVPKRPLSPAPAAPQDRRWKLYLLSAVSACRRGIALLRLRSMISKTTRASTAATTRCKYSLAFWIIAFWASPWTRSPGSRTSTISSSTASSGSSPTSPPRSRTVDFATLYEILYRTPAAQALRQGLRGGTDTASGGVTTPILSTTEDIITYFAVSWLL